MTAALVTCPHLGLCFVPTPAVKILKSHATSLSSRTSAFMSSVSVADSCALTPEGFGFSSPIGRVSKSRGGLGYYKALGSDSVIDVMAGINAGEDKTDVGEFDCGLFSNLFVFMQHFFVAYVMVAPAASALVFDTNNDLLGIFTDADYIRLATERSAKAPSEEESATFMTSPVSNFMTPASELICVDEKNTASQAVAIMNANSGKATLIVGYCSSNSIALIYLVT